MKDPPPEISLEKVLEIDAAYAKVREEWQRRTDNHFAGKSGPRIITAEVDLDVSEAAVWLKLKKLWWVSARRKGLVGRARVVYERYSRQLARVIEDGSGAVRISIAPKRSATTWDSDTSGCRLPAMGSTGRQNVDWQRMKARGLCAPPPLLSRPPTGQSQYGTCGLLPPASASTLPRAASDFPCPATACIGRGNSAKRPVPLRHGLSWFAVLRSRRLRSCGAGRLRR